MVKRVSNEGNEVQDNLESNEDLADMPDYEETEEKYAEETKSNIKGEDKLDTLILLEPEILEVLTYAHDKNEHCGETCMDKNPKLHSFI